MPYKFGKSINILQLLLCLFADYSDIKDLSVFCLKKKNYTDSVIVHIFEF